jgi:hypothetical protein
MKLLLHIGSHKTGSTSIQHFCTLNSGLLKSQGYLYPKNPDSAYVPNYLAAQLAKGQGNKTAEYLKQVCEQAQRGKCHTVVISAESFYGMTWFFLDNHGKPWEEDYWQIETRLIEEMRKCCDGYDEIRIACYLKPQDEYAVSLYNQFVKNNFGISDSFEEWVERAKPIFNFERHIRLWESVFGADAIFLRNFSTSKQDLSRDFCENFLNSDCFHKAEHKEFRSNLRLSRDVLESKRIFNRTQPDRSLAYVSARSYREITPNFPDKPGYQVYAPYEFRKNVFGHFLEGNRLLAERYELGELLPVSNSYEPTYPGLSPEKASEVDLCYSTDMNRLRNRLELGLRRIINFLMDRLPGGRALFAPLRSLQNRLRLKFSGW